MILYNWNQITEERLNPLATRQMLHGSTITVAKLRTNKGSDVPPHSHMKEQITTVEQGAMLFVTPTEQIVVRAGESLCIPSNVPHSVESLEHCVAVDIFSPVTEDWV